MNVKARDLNFFLKIFRKTTVLLCEATESLFLTFALGFKGLVDHCLACFVTCTQWISQIHLWCYTHWPLGGQHGGQVVFIHMLLNVSKCTERELGPGSAAPVSAGTGRACFYRKCWNRRYLDRKCWNGKSLFLPSGFVLTCCVKKRRSSAWAAVTCLDKRLDDPCRTNHIPRTIDRL